MTSAAQNVSHNSHLVNLALLFSHTLYRDPHIAHNLSIQELTACQQDATSDIWSVTVILLLLSSAMDVLHHRHPWHATGWLDFRSHPISLPGRLSGTSSMHLDKPRPHRRTGSQDGTRKHPILDAHTECLASAALYMWPMTSFESFAPSLPLCANMIGG